MASTDNMRITAKMALQGVMRTSGAYVGTELMYSRLKDIIGICNEATSSDWFSWQVSIPVANMVGPKFWDCPCPNRHCTIHFDRPVNLKALHELLHLNINQVSFGMVFTAATEPNAPSFGSIEESAASGGPLIVLVEHSTHASEEAKALLEIIPRPKPDEGSLVNLSSPLTSARPIDPVVGKASGNTNQVSAAPETSSRLLPHQRRAPVSATSASPGSLEASGDTNQVPASPVASSGQSANQCPDPVTSTVSVKLANPAVGVGPAANGGTTTVFFDFVAHERYEKDIDIEYNTRISDEYLDKYAQADHLVELPMADLGSVILTPYSARSYLRLGCSSHTSFREDSLERVSCWSHEVVDFNAMLAELQPPTKEEVSNNIRRLEDQMLVSLELVNEGVVVKPLEVFPEPLPQLGMIVAQQFAYKLFVLLRQYNLTKDYDKAQAPSLVAFIEAGWHEAGKEKEQFYVVTTGPEDVILWQDTPRTPDINPFDGRDYGLEDPFSQHSKQDMRKYDEAYRKCWKSLGADPGAFGTGQVPLTSEMAEFGACDLRDACTSIGNREFMEYWNLRPQGWPEVKQDRTYEEMSALELRQRGYNPLYPLRPEDIDIATIAAEAPMPDDVGITTRDSEEHPAQPVAEEPRLNTAACKSPFGNSDCVDLSSMIPSGSLVIDGSVETPKNLSPNKAVRLKVFDNPVSSRPLATFTPVSGLANENSDVIDDNLGSLPPQNTRPSSPVRDTYDRIISQAAFWNEKLWSLVNSDDMGGTEYIEALKQADAVAKPSGEKQWQQMVVAASAVCRLPLPWTETRTTELVMLESRPGYFAEAHYGMARLRHVASTDDLQIKLGSLDNNDLRARFLSFTIAAFCIDMMDLSYEDLGVKVYTPFRGKKIEPCFTETMRSTATSALATPDFVMDFITLQPIVDALYRLQLSSSDRG
ncbi:hypothetical protein EV127DRAFT_503177 [Xylaria flabelliformis]|nr:hypothetical protein EV127DRAFT_503177 [Xylaria flabelliformis]